MTGANIAFDQGVPDWPLVNLASRVGINLSKQYAFHNTSVSKSEFITPCLQSVLFLEMQPHLPDDVDIDYAFQALAIDERRLTFPPTLWHRTQDAPAKDLQQCWFPGVHQNIGGGAPDSEIEDITFAWMVCHIFHLFVQVIYYHGPLSTNSGPLGGQSFWNGDF